MAGRQAGCNVVHPPTTLVACGFALYVAHLQTDSRVVAWCVQADKVCYVPASALLLVDFELRSHPQVDTEREGGAVAMCCMWQAFCHSWAVLTLQLTPE